MNFLKTQNLIGSTFFARINIEFLWHVFFYVFTNKFYKVRLKSQSTWHQHQQWQRKCYEVYKDDIEVKDEKLVFQKNADLHKPVLNKIMITHDQCGKYNFVAHLNNSTTNFYSLIFFKNSFPNWDDWVSELNSKLGICYWVWTKEMYLELCLFR